MAWSSAIIARYCWYCSNLDDDGDFDAVWLDWDCDNAVVNCFAVVPVVEGKMRDYNH